MKPIYGHNGQKQALSDHDKQRQMADLMTWIEAFGRTHGIRAVGKEDECGL